MKEDNRKTLKEFIDSLSNKKTKLFIGENTSFYLVCTAEYLLENEERIIAEMKDIAEKLFREDENVLFAYYHGIDTGSESFPYIAEIAASLTTMCSDYRKTNKLFVESQKWKSDLFTGKKVNDSNKRIDETGINVILEGKGNGKYWDEEEWNRSYPEEIDPEEFLKELVNGNVKNYLRRGNSPEKGGDECQ